MLISLVSSLKILIGHFSITQSNFSQKTIRHEKNILCNIFGRILFRLQKKSDLHIKIQVYSHLFKKKVTTDVSWKKPCLLTPEYKRSQQNCRALVSKRHHATQHGSLVNSLLGKRIPTLSG